MTDYIVDTHGLVWFLEESPKLGEKAREAFLDEDSNLIMPTIVLAEIKFLFDKNRFSTSLDDAIIAANGLLFKERRGSEDVVIITKDEEITNSKLVKTIW